VRRRRVIGAAVAAVAAVTAGAQAQPSGAARVALRAHREAGEYEEAIAAARRADLAAELGELLRMTGRYPEAQRVLTAARAAGGADSLLVILQLGLLREELGARHEAFRDYDRLIAAYNRRRGLTSAELAAVGTAVERLSMTDPQLARDALRAFDEAIAADRDNLDAQLAVGALFLARYNGAEAQATFERVLARDSLQPRALLGLARVARFSGTGGVSALLERSLEINPRLVDARVFRAELLSEVDDHAGARREIAAALEVNPRSPAALSTRAAVAWLTGDSAEFEAARRSVLDANPRSAIPDLTAADLAARHRLYADAARFARQAVARDSLSWRGWALLGVNELRLGRMDSGRVHLERAFAGDPYDVWTKNTLDLLDTLEVFPARRFERFQVVADAAEVDALTPYVAPLAEEAYASMARRYGVTAPPIRIELFRRHADFSVRTMGLVGLGALGVSFGPVVAMDSPTARPRGEFNWGSTLWHEIAHSFHMAASRHRVPRWFTEGLAVYEERMARPGWGDDASPGFLTAYKAGRLLPVSRLNDGFVRPAYPEQVGFSYYQASLVCERIAEGHGFDALVRMLRAYGNGRDTRHVFREVLGVELDSFDGAFADWLEHRFATQLAALGSHGDGRGAPPSPSTVLALARSRPDDFRAQLLAGQGLVRDGRLTEAVPFLERAKSLFPEYAEEDGPYRLLADVARARGDLGRAEAELAAMTARNERSYDAHLALADVRLAVGDSAGALRALDALLYVDPTEPDVHVRLAELAEAQGKTALAAREWRVLVALDPADPVTAYYRLARAELAAGNREAARRAVLRALEQAPGFEPALELLLELRSGGGDGSDGSVR
jgi:tetratricopeptide (TPR) repeat protein